VATLDTVTSQDHYSGEVLLITAYATLAVLALVWGGRVLRKFWRR